MWVPMGCTSGEVEPGGKLFYAIIACMEQTIQTIISQINELKKEYQKEGFEIVGIFGSYARGTADRYSDVDIAYAIDYDKFNQKFKGGFAKLLRIEEIKKELQRLLRIKIDLVSLDGSSDRFKNKIKEDILYV